VDVPRTVEITAAAVAATIDLQEQQHPSTNAGRHSARQRSRIGKQHQHAAGGSVLRHKQPLPLHSSRQTSGSTMLVVEDMVPGESKEVQEANQPNKQVKPDTGRQPFVL
jgi:hypothetical protein